MFPSPRLTGKRVSRLAELWFDSAEEIAQAFSEPRYLTFQKPYPKIYQPFSFSPETIRWCAHEDIMPIILYTDIEKLKKLYRLYQDEAAVAGPNW